MRKGEWAIALPIIHFFAKLFLQKKREKGKNYELLQITA